MKSLLIKSHLAEKSKLDKMQVIDNPTDLARVSGGQDPDYRDGEVTYHHYETYFGPIDIPYDSVVVEITFDDPVV